MYTYTSSKILIIKLLFINMKKKFIQGYFKVKKEGDKLSIVASDETLDRHGDVIKVESWDLSNFKKAPRMLVDHDHRVEKIVGKWEDIQVDGKSLTMSPVFHDFTPLAVAVKEMVNEGFLDTVSVGFIPHGPEKDGDTGRNELIEVSFVTVPANPNARIAKALNETPDAESLAKVKEFAGLSDEEENEEDEDEDEAIIEDDYSDDKKLSEMPVIKSQDDFNNRVDKESDVVVCEVKFIEDLCEKLKTLAKGKKVGMSNDVLIDRALKDVAKNISFALMKRKENS